MSTIPKWDEERTNTLINLVGNENPISNETVQGAADTLGTSTRSVAAKLRKLNYNVAPVSKVVTKTFTDTESEAVRAFVESNPSVYTYAEIAASVLDGKFTAKEVQGKILSMELTDLVKPTEKQEVAKKYTDAEEATFLKLLANGAFIEDIAEKLGKTINSVRGKALSLSRTVEGFVMPKQRESHAKTNVDALSALGNISELTVAEIAQAIGKTDRGVRTMLTHRKLACADYDGAKRAERISEKKAVNG